MQPLIKEIGKKVHEAALGKRKIAMFHFQVLKNAVALEGVTAQSFCKDIGVPVTYATEFQKMLGLARLMKQEGCRLV